MSWLSKGLRSASSAIIPAVSSAAALYSGYKTGGVSGMLGSLNNPSFGGLSSALGQQQVNRLSAGEAQKNRDFQASMSSTAYQRAVQDMRAAGVNPLLAFSQGGASTPSGAMGQFGNVGGAGVQGYGAMSSAQQAQASSALSVEQATKVRSEVLMLIPAQVRQLDANGDLARANISVSEATEKLKAVTAALAEMDKAALEKLGLSMAQIQYKPSNQIGSLLVDVVVDAMKADPDLLKEDISTIITVLLGD